MTSTTASPTQHHDLYIALFARTSTPRTYHWALLVCASNLRPTATAGIRYHVTNSIPNPPASDPSKPLPQNIDPGRIPWRFEAQPLLNLFTASPLLARVLISRRIIVDDPNVVRAALEAVPLIQDDKTWTCRVWVRDALAHLVKQGIIDLPSPRPPPPPHPPTPDPTTLLTTAITNGRLTLSDESWTAIESACLTYLESKHAVGRWRVASEGRWVEGEVPTWDLWAGKEIIA